MPEKVCKMPGPASFSGVIKMPRLLELFCGTKGVGRCFSEKGWEVISVDSLSKWNPTIIADVRQLPITIGQGFDMIWASPPCTLYSTAPSQLFTADERIKRAEEGNAVSRRTMEVINIFSRPGMPLRTLTAR